MNLNSRQLNIWMNDKGFVYTSDPCVLSLTKELFGIKSGLKT